MSTQQVFRLRNPALLVALAAAFPVVSYAASAANVNFSTGSVVGINAAGVQRPLTRGADIGNGDTIRTGEGGRAQIRFSDGAMVSLQPQTEFRIDDYQYSGKADGKEKGFFSLLKGGLRTITGWIGRSSRDSYKVSTSVATIGIRGTEYTAGLSPSGETLAVATGEGLVEVCNNTGCILLASGEAGVAEKGSPPRRESSRPRLPPAALPPSNDDQREFVSGDQVNSAGLPAVGASFTTGHIVNTGGVFHGDSTVSLDASGNLIGYTSGSFSSSIGTASVADSGTSDTILKWGRWASGTSTVDNVSVTLSANQGVHLLWGVPTAIMPTSGTGTYSLLGGTSPTETGGSLTPGTLSSASMSVDFGALTYSVSLGGTISGVATTFSASGAGSLTSNKLNTTSLTGLIGACSATGSVAGMFFGSSAERAGITYKLDDGTYTVVGAAALKQ
ncbi:MAG: FecR domain-containing protein [Propionivibrio sp.]|nr:FecR domain-containing protein [Propionivibrio sp.]